MSIIRGLIIYLLRIIPSLLGIGLILFLHEFGHFTAAKILKVDVECLSLGIGPKLISFHGKQTEFRISAIPFGGYCRMHGSIDLTKALRENADSFDKTEAGSYFSAAPVKRFLIFFAGPLANFILASILFSLASAIPAEHISDKAFITPISEYPAVFSSSIKQPEVMKGDLVKSADGIDIVDYQDLERYLSTLNGQTSELTILRDGNIVTAIIYPILREDGNYSYGISLLQRPIIGRSESDSFKAGDVIATADDKIIEWTYDLYTLGRRKVNAEIIRDGSVITCPIDLSGALPFAWHSELRRYSEHVNHIAYGLYKASDVSMTTLEALGALMTFQVDDARTIITGPMKAASTFSSISALAFRTSTSSGLRAVLTLLAFVSISISVGNLLPIPTFDGGGMLMSVAEMIKRKPLKPKTYVVLQISGMIIAYAIIAFMYGLDIKDILTKN